MRKMSRRQEKNRKKTKKIVFSDLEQAITVLKETSNTKFLETVELHANLNIDPKYADQQLRTTLTLPHGIGKTVKVAVLTNEENFIHAQENGADIVGNDDLIQEISQGNLDFDLLIATPDIMPKLAKIGRILGPKGLMPSPKSGTVTTTIAQTLLEFKKGKFEYKADKSGIVHVSFGRANFPTTSLIENLTALYKSIEKKSSIWYKR